MNKLFLTSAVIVTSTIAIYGAVIGGSVQDVDKQPLVGATIQLLEFPDSTVKGMTITDKKGNYSISKVKPGNYAVRASMVGMDPAFYNIQVADTTRKVTIPTLTLVEESTLLSEAIVTGVKAAVVAKQDTMEFNADSFKTHVNSNVEDLLKKLPGVEVGSDGSITSGGKTVSKILVDGKEFFGEDTKMATKNLPSELVDKVQVVDRKSDLARITGVDDGEEETVINLTVKKNMKNGWMGTIGGGYGTDKRYEGSMNLSTFTNTGQLSIVGGANNTNDLGFMDSGRGRFMNFGPSGGINTSQRLGVNFNLGKTETFRVGGNVFYTHSDREATSYSDTQYLFPNDSVSYNKSGSYSRDKGHNIRADFRMEWKIDENNTLDFRPRFAFNLRDSELNDTSRLNAGDPKKTLVNTNKNKKVNKGNGWEAGGELIFNHNFASHPGRSFSVQGRYEFSDTRQRTTTWNDIEYMLRHDDSETLYRWLDSHQWNNSVQGRLSWTEPLGDPKRGNFLQFSYRVQYRFNNSDKNTYNLPLQEDIKFDTFLPVHYTSVPDGAIFDEDLSNQFRNTFSTQELRVGYKKVNAMYNLDAGLVFAPSSTKSEDILNSARNIDTRWVWNVAPFMRFRYKFSKTKSLRINYRANSSSPSVSQLQPVADVSDPMNIVTGNPNLKPTFTQSINANFNNYVQETQQSMFAMLNASYSQNVVVSRTVSNPQTGKRETTYANANGNFSARGMFMVNQPFRNRHWRFSARMMANFSSSAGYINGDFNRTGHLTLAPNLGLTFSSDIFQITARPTYSYSLTTNTLPAQRNKNTNTIGFTADATLTLPFGLELASDVAYDKLSGYSEGFNTSSWLWNAQISYSVLSDKSLTFSVRAYDILADKKNISRSVSTSMIVDNRYNDLTRYLMFGVTWKFNTLKNRGKNLPGSDFPGGMTPPPGAPMGGHPGGGGGRPF